MALPPKKHCGQCGYFQRPRDPELTAVMGKCLHHDEGEGGWIPPSHPTCIHFTHQTKQQKKYASRIVNLLMMEMAILPLTIWIVIMFAKPQFGLYNPLVLFFLIFIVSTIGPGVFLYRTMRKK